MPTLQTASGTLRYKDSDAGAPVIALHGSASGAEQWKSLTGYIEGGFRVLAPDLPGYGGSDPVAPPTRGSLDAVAGRIAALIEHVGAPAHLVGHGFGGAVALKLATSRPAAVRSLALIEPSAFHLLRRASIPDRRLLGALEEVADALGSFACEGDPWTGMGRFVDFWNGEGAWFRSSDRLRAAMAASVGQVLDDLAALGREPDRLDAAAAVATPTLCIMGLQSPPVAMRVTELVAETIPGARLELVADAGHMAPLTDPHIVDPMIRRHLMEVDSRGRAAAPRPVPIAA